MAENAQCQWNQVDMMFFGLQFKNIVGRCLWSLSVGSPDYIFNDVFFMIRCYAWTLLAGGETWQATSCPPFHIPLLCILDIPTIFRVQIL